MTGKVVGMCVFFVLFCFFTVLVLWENESALEPNRKDGPEVRKPVSMQGAARKVVRKGRYAGKRILEIDAYHEEYKWTAGITAGVQRVVGKTDAVLKVHRMDTKRNPSEEFIKAAALKAKKLIETFRPDVVIAADDNVAKYLIVPYYINSDIPFVFCGVNWSAREYGFPCKNVTGQIEVDHIIETYDLLKRYAKGERIGFIACDRLSERKELEHFERMLKRKFDRHYFVKSYSEWKTRFAEIQRQVDMLIVANHVGLDGFNAEDAEEFVRQNSRIPSGTYMELLMPYAMLGVVKDEDEVGSWAAEKALEILDGKSPSEIPVDRNKRGKLCLNVLLALKAGVVFDSSLLEAAAIVIKSGEDTSEAGGETQ